MNKLEDSENNRFWCATIEELIKGHYEDEEHVYCLICGNKFPKGEIFQHNDKLYDCYKMTKVHITERHGSMINYLLNMNPAFLGITKSQQSILKLIVQGLSDKEISEKKGISPSTVRNYRFRLHEHEKKAKMFIATMSIYEAKKDGADSDKPRFFDAHKTAKMLDDRYDVTDKEKNNVINKFFSSNGSLKSFNVKEKSKIIILRKIAENFAYGRYYDEKEVNCILLNIYDDYPYLRRLLIEYGFLERTIDGSKYWRDEWRENKL